MLMFKAGDDASHHPGREIKISWSAQVANLMGLVVKLRLDLSTHGIAVVKHTNYKKINSLSLVS